MLLCIVAEDVYKDVTDDLSARLPFVSFTADGATGVFILQFHDEAHYISDMVLSHYSKLHPLVKQLAILLKHLAKVSNHTAKYYDIANLVPLP